MTFDEMEATLNLLGWEPVLFKEFGGVLVYGMVRGEHAFYMTGEDTNGYHGVIAGETMIQGSWAQFRLSQIETMLHTAKVRDGLGS